MAVEVKYKASVSKDLRRLGRGNAERLLGRIERTLGDDPDAGEPLSGPYRGLRRLRIGDHRVIYTRGEGGVLVLRVAHRKDAYSGGPPAH